MSLRTADCSDLQTALADGPLQFVDVRTAMEFRGRHIEGAENRPMGSLAHETLDVDRPVWLICRSGARSANAALELSAAGFDVVDVQGGLMAWKGATVGRGPHLLLPRLAAMGLGLAPFVPEPHIVGKLRWVLGGAEGMAPMDWFDIVLHGAPWVWLAWSLLSQRNKANGS